MSQTGRPRSYKPEYCDLARNYCLLGATNEQLGAFFNVTRQTIHNWIDTVPEFAAAVQDARDLADARVARSLYDRAVGFTYERERTVLHRGEERTLRQTVFCPPDTRACIHWLHNRRREQWSPKPPSSDAEWEEAERQAAASTAAE